MRRAVYRGICICIAVSLLASCGLGETKTAEEWFDFTWSGLAGIDSLKFKGQAAVTRGESWTLDEQLGYRGVLKDHRSLSMQSTLPSADKHQKEGQIEAASTLQDQIQFSWNGKTWSVQSGQESGLTAGLSRFNPLEQIESIRRAAKTITEERGAARGTRVLRIQLSSDAAKQILSQQLIKEMEAVRTDWRSRLQSLPEKGRSEASSALEREWSTGRLQLDHMLDTCKAETVYYLTISRSTGLPERMTSETRLVYRNARGIEEQEAMLTDSKFDYGK